MIALTDTAAVKVHELIVAEGEDALALRVAVRPGGCSGFSYEMFFDSDVADDDVTAAFSGVKVVVDSTHLERAEPDLVRLRLRSALVEFRRDRPTRSAARGCHLTNRRSATTATTVTSTGW